MKLWYRMGSMFLGLGIMGALVVPAHASDYAAQVKAATDTKYRNPEDMLDMIPFLGQIPRTFLIGDGFKMRLTTKELRIDHMGTRSHNPASGRNCMIGFSYTTPVAGFFTYRVDLPLLHAATPALEDWSRSSLGDYVVYLSKTPVDRASLRLVLTAKF
jgi:hypothetical protein